jgi:hypothetical protein
MCPDRLYAATQQLGRCRSNNGHSSGAGRRDTDVADLDPGQQARERRLSLFVEFDSPAAGSAQHPRVALKLIPTPWRTTSSSRRLS